MPRNPILSALDFFVRRQRTESAGHVPLAGPTDSEKRIIEAYARGNEDCLDRAIEVYDRHNAPVLRTTVPHLAYMAEVVTDDPDPVICNVLRERMLRRRPAPLRPTTAVCAL